MITTIERRAAAFAVAATLCLALAATRATAQEGGAPVPPPPDSSAAPTAPVTPPAVTPAPTTAPAPAVTASDTTGLTLPILADVRPRATVAADLSALEATRSSAASRMVQAREAEIRWRARVELEKSAIEALKKRQDLLKKEKRDAEAKDLDRQKRAEEAKRTYYERVRDMYGAEGDYWKSAVEYSDARRVALQSEMHLAERWAGGGAIDRTPETVASEIRAIDATRDEATKSSMMNDRARAWGDRRKSAYDAWKRL
jgi:hypothetical protein